MLVCTLTILCRRTSFANPVRNYPYDKEPLWLVMGWWGFVFGFDDMFRCSNLFHEHADYGVEFVHSCLARDNDVVQFLDRVLLEGQLGFKIFNTGRGVLFCHGASITP